MLKKFIALFGAQDMTVGSPFMCLLKFSVPLLIGNIAQLLYFTVDTIIVGKALGDAAMAAIGISNPVQNLFMVFFMAIGTGVTIMVAQYFGAKDFRTLGDAVGNSITLIAIISVVITAVTVPLSTQLLRIVNAPQDTFEMARVYLQILFIGTAANGFYNVLSGILRGLGESVFPLVVLLISVAINGVLDYLFVAIFNWGLGGAATATIIAQLISAVICFVKVIRMRSVLQLRKSTLVLKRAIVRHIIRLGVPQGLSTGIMFVSTILVQYLINDMGTMVIAAITATMRVDGFAVLPSMTFGMAASTYTGQNIGAGKIDRVRQGTTTVFWMCLVFTAVMIAAMLLFGRSMLGLFTETDAVIRLGIGFIQVMAVAYLAMVVNQCYSGVMRGAGDAMGPMWISIGVNVLLRLPLSYLFAYLSKSAEYPSGHPNSVFLSLFAAMLVGAVITVIYYRKGNWRSKSIVQPLAGKGAAADPA
jgi:putative MATE family efflux protein